MLDRVERESVFYAHGEGGLTLSGGEPFFQSDFALELLREAKKRRIRTAVETSGYCEPEVLREAAEYLDYILYDIKSMDAEKHARVIGADNRLILDNLEMLFREFPGLHKHVRTPVIPGFNDAEEETTAIREFLRGRRITLTSSCPTIASGRESMNCWGGKRSGYKKRNSDCEICRYKSGRNC